MENNTEKQNNLYITWVIFMGHKIYVEDYMLIWKQETDDLGSVTSIVHVHKRLDIYLEERYWSYQGNYKACTLIAAMRAGKTIQWPHKSVKVF